ncbi:MAG: patatin-like protein, partial [Alphaproteobacteria bacterium]
MIDAKPPLKEIRIGLVLYGGVSLAVYMNGITTELWHLLRASQARAKDERGRLEGTTAAVYARMLDELAAVEELRVVVDTIAGSSAGGVNGAALAKAVADGADASVLCTVWLQDADIAALRVDPPRSPFWVRALAWTACRITQLGSLRDKVDALPGLSWDWLRDTAYNQVTTKDGRDTPLNGRYFTRMIGSTFRAMTERGNGVSLVPNRGTLDLFLTRTDVHGWPRHLPVSEEFHQSPLYETTHAHVMAFHSSPTLQPGGGTGERPPLADDFALTFACRSTAGFPGAFAPLNADHAAVDFAEARADADRPDLGRFGARHLREHTLFERAPDAAWMIDGGVLDNRPFTDVARAIERKPADHEVYRVVAFVEPDPDAAVMTQPDKAMPLPPQVLKGLYRLFRHEPIYDDLRALGDRNARVERICAIRDANRPGAAFLAERLGRSNGLSWPPAPAELDDWDKLLGGSRTDAPDLDYPGYMVLRARCAADTLAGVICAALDYPRASRHAFFIRTLVRAWLDRQGAFEPPAPAEGGEGLTFTVAPAQTALLAAFDVPFRVRQLRSLVQAVNRGYGPPEDAESGSRRRDLDRAKAALAEVAFGYEALLRDVDAVA